MPPRTRPLAERFWPKVDKSDPSGCWIWTAARNPVSGYGQVGAGGRYGGMLLAHRVAYELTVGPIPDGMTLDHVCNRRECVNPAHLDPCTTQVNTARGKERRTACRVGHPRRGNISRAPDGAERCRACNTERAREYRARARADERR